MDKTRRLIDELLRATADGRIEWDKGESQSQFIFDTGRGSVVLDRSPWDTGGRDIVWSYTVHIISKDGDIVDKTEVDPSGEMSPYDRIAALYHTVDRAYRNVDSVIDGIISEIKETERFEPDDELPF